MLKSVHYIKNTFYPSVTDHGPFYVFTHTREAADIRSNNFTKHTFIPVVLFGWFFFLFSQKLGAKYDYCVSPRRNVYTPIKKVRIHFVRPFVRFYSATKIKRERPYKMSVILLNWLSWPLCIWKSIMSSAEYDHAQIVHGKFFLPRSVCVSVHININFIRQVWRKNLIFF